MFLETIVKTIVTTRSELGKLGSFDNDAIEKEISVTKKGKTDRLTRNGHQVIDLRLANIEQ